MIILFNTLQRLHTDERGTTSIDYALLAALFAISVIAGMTAFSEAAGNLWSTTSDAIVAALTQN